jgi:hypothetical protein
MRTCSAFFKPDSEIGRPRLGPLKINLFSMERAELPSSDVSSFQYIWIQALNALAQDLVIPTATSDQFFA